MTRQHITEQLVHLSRRIGDPGKNYVILGEGNTSARIDDHHFFVKASGAALATAAEGDFLEMATEAVLGVIDAGRLKNDEVERRLNLAKMDRATPARPSVETIMHAIMIREAGSMFVAHTHPTAVNAILCSKQARELFGGWLLPEHAIFLGPEPVFVDYHDPGQLLAIATRDAIREFMQRRGHAPKSVLMRNHGLIVGAATPGEVEAMTAMWVKASEILLGTLFAGGPEFLSPDAVDRLLSRVDTMYHREQSVQES